VKDEKTKKDEYQKALAAYADAIKEFRKQKFEKAAEALRSFAEKYPGERELVARARMYAAVADERLKEPKESRVLKTAGDHINCAVYRMNMGETEEVQKLVEKALKLDPEDARAHYLQALLQSQAGELEAALESLRETFQLDHAYRILAQNEAEFEGLWDDKRFKALTRTA
jgi:tetratricopeptide (TPR) repeat protein